MIMSGWNAGYGKEESFIEFTSKDKNKVKAVEKVCCAIMDKEVSCPDDIEVVRHGKWLSFTDDGKQYEACSECEYTKIVGGANSWCPACGARMEVDGE